MFEPYKIPRPNVYDVIPDSMNNGFLLPLGGEEIGRIDAKTGAITAFKTPTPGSGPRRGMMDAQERLWFGENRADRIGMFDTRTGRFEEWRAADARRLALRRHGRSNRRRVVRRRIQRSYPASGSSYGPLHRISPAPADERPTSFRPESNDAGHLLGGQQPRRLDRQTGAARRARPHDESLTPTAQASGPEPPPTRRRIRQTVRDTARSIRYSRAAEQFPAPCNH